MQFPHDVFAHYGGRHADFVQVFGSDEDIRSFWRQKDRSDPAFKSHPALLQPEFQRLCIPCRLHSDTVVMSKTDSLHIVSWSSYFGVGGVLESQLVFAALAKSCAWQDETGNKKGTFDEMYQALQWSFSACLQGKHPALDWRGEPWPAGSPRAKIANAPLHPDGKFLGVMQLCGDLEELANKYGLAHWGANEPCFWCGCDTTDVPWSDLSPEAAWRRTVKEHQAANPAPSGHLVWTIPGLNIWSVGWDVLHGLDLGPTLHVLGNGLEDLVQCRQLGRTLDERVKKIWAQAQDYYHSMGIKSRISRLDLNSWRHAGSFPKMRAKAHEARSFLPVLQALLDKHCAGVDAYATTRAQMLTCLLEFYAVLSSKEQFLTPEAANRGRRMGLEFLRHYSWLSHTSLQQGLLRWQMTMKFHYMAHACEQLQWSNLRWASTYRGESYVGQVAKIGYASSFGKPPYFIGGLLMQKLQAGRAVRMRKQSAIGLLLLSCWVVVGGFG